MTADPIPPASTSTQQLNIDGIAIRVVLAMVALFAVVWAVDEHFITRREFNTQMGAVRLEVAAMRKDLGLVSKRLGIKPTVPTPREPDVDP